MRCPHCQRAWMVWRDDSVEHVGHCEHLHFTWFSGYQCGEPAFIRECQSDQLLEACKTEFDRYIDATPHLRDQEEFPVIRTVDCLRTLLRNVDSTDINEVWEYEFWDSGSNIVGETVAVFWGVKFEAP